jgi:hypothetical protein
LGTYLIIEGERVETADGSASHVLAVDTVGGKKLAKPITTVVMLAKGCLPPGRIVIRGYESGRTVGTPAGVEEQKEGAGSRVPFHFQRYFLVRSWDQPDGPMSMDTVARVRGVIPGRDDDWGNTEVPMGKLKLPLGTPVTVEGVAAKGAFKVNPTNTLVVDTVNGKKLEHPTSVVIQRLRGSLPQTGRVILKGYEGGAMIGGPPPGVPKREGEMLPQAMWQFYTSFVISSWVEPDGPVDMPWRLREPSQSPPPPPGVPGAPAPAAGEPLEKRLKRIRETQERLQKTREKAAATEKGD